MLCLLFKDCALSFAIIYYKYIFGSLILDFVYCYYVEEKHTTKLNVKIHYNSVFFI